MEGNYFDYLYGANVGQKATAEDSITQATVAQDEAIGKPWTHRFTIYCANPSKEFIAELKKNDCIVAVYEKAKEAPSND